MPCALLASCCSSMSSVMNSSLKEAFSSKFVEPVHSVSSVALLFVVQSSTSVFPLGPFVWRTIVLCCVNLVTSGPSSVCCGMYKSLLGWTCTRFHMCPSRIQWSDVRWTSLGCGIVVVVNGGGCWEGVLSIGFLTACLVCLHCWRWCFCCSWCLRCLWWQRWWLWRHAARKRCSSLYSEPCFSYPCLSSQDSFLLWRIEVLILFFKVFIVAILPARNIVLL